MKSLTLFLSFIFVTSCVDQETQRKAETDQLISKNEEQTRKSIASLQSLENDLKPTISTKDDKADVSKKATIYYEGLFASIVKLDDGKSDAATIGKAAVSQNIPELREWKKAQLIHYWRNPAHRDRVQATLLELPTSFQWDEATTAVLEIRQKKRQ